MPVTVDYQYWDSASYNWLDNASATAPAMQIQEKLAAWVSAVNANASNVSRPVSIRKSPSDSTLTNNIGWVIECSSTTAEKGLFTRFYSSSTTNINVLFHTSWVDNGSNGGYGTYSGNFASDTSVSWATSGVAAEFSVAAGTEDGQEFFCLGWRLNNSTSQSDIILIFKDANGEWAGLFTDGGSLAIGSYYMDVHSSPQRSFGVSVPTLGSNSSAGYLTRLAIQTSSATYAASDGVEYTTAMTAASPALFYTTTTANWGYGRWATFADGRTAVCMGFGPVWVAY